jgi:hypothetical protein
VTNCSNEASGLEGRDELVAFGDVHREGLLDQGVHACGGQLESSVEMRFGRKRNDTHVDAVLNELIDRVEDWQAARCVEPVTELVGRTYQFDIVHGLQNAGVIFAHHPEAGKTGTKLCHREQASEPSACWSAIEPSGVDSLAL